MVLLDTAISEYSIFHHESSFGSLKESAPSQDPHEILVPGLYFVEIPSFLGLNTL